jgi:quinoprotein glucose dehydrogenase
MIFQKQTFFSPLTPFRGLLLISVLGALMLDRVSSVAAELTDLHPSVAAVESLRGMTVQPGLKVQIFASEPLFANPVAFTFDDQGRCYLVETHRRRTSVFDIRRFPDWLDDDFSFRTVDDRREFLKLNVRPNNPSIADRYRVDRNRDGLFDIDDLEVESERIRLLTDQDGDGVADRATTFAEGFDSSVSGVAAGILAQGDSVWFTCIPDLWRLRDRNQNGEADDREVLHTGFGVHMAFGGHDFHGVIMGPDGRLYFSIADRGSHVEKDGEVLAALPDTGAVFRCEPDGSQFEVVATGLRNPQELAFDDFGNLWTVDNNGDGGDQARLVQVVEGGNSGWQIGWQWLPDMGPWKAEKLWQVASKNTAAYLLPPLAYVGHGPAGLAYYPGTGLPAKFKKHFFLADFPGGVRSFKVEPRGATFTVSHSREYLQNNSAEAMAGKLIWGLSPVDVGFSPEGGLYVADWIQGWEKTGKGRIFRLFDEAVLASSEVAEVKKLLADGLKDFSVKELADLLAHVDQRVRLRAQFELARRYQPSRTAVAEVITGALGLNPLSMLKRVIEESDQQLARVHAIWGVGQILAKHRDASSILIPFLSDKDPEIRSQVAKTLADRGVVGFYSDYSALLKDPSLRVQFYGALWLGKTVKRGYHEVQASDGSNQLVNLRDTSAIYDLIRRNADADLYVRHAGVMALTWINDMAGLVEVATSPNRSIRLAAVLALRRLKRPEITSFLNDKDPQVVLETVRAIYDENIEAALPQLAELSRQPNLAEPVLRRALNALLRLGKTENAAFLVAFAENSEAPEALRVEALEALSVWGNPPKRDRVIGRWRPLSDRDSRSAIVPLRLALSNLFSDPSEAIQEATIKAMNRLGIDTERERLHGLVANSEIGTSVRLAAFDALAQSGGEDLLTAVRTARSSSVDSLREKASQSQTALPIDEAIQLFKMDLKEDSIGLRRAALRGLAVLEDPRAGRILESWLDRLLGGNMANELVLDVLDAAAKSSYEPLAAKAQEYEQGRALDDRFAVYREVLYGGDPEKGRKLYEERLDLACARCHRLGDLGGDVGPNLAGIGLRLSKEKLLQSILYPNDEISPGFESVSVELREGGFYAGIVKDENDSELVLSSLEDGDMTFAKADISSRSVGLSAMPEQLINMLTKQDLRDLIEFLSELK